jgi:hypothetical protein
MALNNISFNIGEGGLGRPLAGEDHISGLLYYSNTLPSGFASDNRIKLIYSLEEAEALGITDENIGETKATGTITVTAAGSQNDSILVKVDEGDITVTLGTAIVPATPTTTTVATAIAAAVNASTAEHGYSASSSSAVVTISAPSGRGVGANSYTFDITITGTATATNVAFGSGVASSIDALHYHVSEYFRIQPKGVLYVGVYATSDVGTFSAVTTMQNFSNGKIRQIGVYQTSSAFATSQVNTLQSIANSLLQSHKPVQVLYAAEISGTADLSGLADLTALSNPKVSVVIGQDGEALGNDLFKARGKSISCLGTALGAVSKAKVHESICWVGKFPIVDGEEFDVLAFGNGNLYRALSDGLIDGLNDKGYIFPRKFVGLNGSYFNDSKTAVAVTSDFATIENNRTMHKAVRDIRTNVLPALGAPLYLNAGKLTEDTVGYFESLAAKPLEDMQAAGEVSEFSVTIDPTQNVLATSKLTITVKIVPVGVAREIVFNIGYTVKLG